MKAKEELVIKGFQNNILKVTLNSILYNKIGLFYIILCHSFIQNTIRIILR